MKRLRFKLPSIRFSGKYDEETTSSFVKETDVNQEYYKAFRTQSYTDICNKVQTHVRFDGEPSSSSSVHGPSIHLCDILLEPQSETIANLTNTFNLNHPLIDFFKASLRSWKIYEELLESIHQVNTNHLRVKHIIKLAQRVPYDTKIFEELDSYSSLVNPLSEFDPQKFPTLHIDQKLLLKKLTTKHKRIKRKQKVINFFKKAGGCVLVASYTVLAVALLVLVCHGLIVTVASSGLIASFFGLIKNSNFAKKRVKPSKLKRIGAQLDVAAKGVYTMIKDLDTIGWLVGRLHNEVEFGKAMARRCFRTRKADVWEEVMREFRVHDICLLEHLEELEDHIYLCLLNVNRSRKLLVDEIIPGHIEN
ncbi:hypothetical protein R6Q57_019707 [Mikania cordata]